MWVIITDERGTESFLKSLLSEQSGDQDMFLCTADRFIEICFESGPQDGVESTETIDYLLGKEAAWKAFSAFKKN